VKGCMAYEVEHDSKARKDDRASTPPAHYSNSETSVPIIMPHGRDAEIGRLKEEVVQLREELNKNQSSSSIIN